MSKQKMMTLSALAAMCMLASLTMHAKAAGQEGMVVVRDAESGKMRAPTPEELRELRAKAPPKDSALTGAPQPQQLMSGRGGARGVRLGENSLVYDVATRGEDGKLSSQCVQGEAAAREAMDHPANAEHKHKEHNHEAR